MIIKKDKFEIDSETLAENEKKSKDAYRKIQKGKINQDFKVKRHIVLVLTPRGIEKAYFTTYEDALNFSNNCTVYYTQIWEYDDEKECYKFKEEQHEYVL